MGAQKLSKEQELQIVEEYRRGESVETLINKYGYKTKKSITDKIKKYFPNEYEKIVEEARNNRRGYYYSLEEITSPFDAYLVGLLLTDGYILSDRDGVGIDMTDEDVIKFIAETIGTTYKKYSSPNTKDRFRILITIPGITKQVERLGIIPRKSLKITKPNLFKKEEKFLPLLVRGIIDGDGCVSKTSYGGAQFYICTMSEQFADWIIDVLENKFFMINIHKSQNSYGMWRIETSNQYNILKLIAIVYNYPFGMNRKYIELRKTFRDYNSDILITKDDGIVQTTTDILV